MCRSTSASASTSTKSQSGTHSMSSSNKKERTKLAKPAFDGATFDRDGNCVKHKSVQLAEQVKQDGRLLWKEIKMNCPKCAAEHHKSRRVTSLGGAGKVKRGRTVHGMSNPLRRERSKSGRHMDVEFDTPFDDRGRCHHHPNVQMASKKVRGGWKILVRACPRCIEARYDEDGGESVNSRASSRCSSRHNNNGGGGQVEDEASVSSKSTKRSVTSARARPATSSGKFDKNGCCTKHPTVQVAKKKLLGGWKETRSCPKCIDPDFDDMADNVSVSSRNSNRSTTSFRSKGSTRSRKSAGGRSVKSNGSRKGGRKTDRYGALPFDEEGYCHAHPGVRLAKKKALGGWKVLHDICPDCAHDASSNAGSRSSKSSRRSSRGTGRYFDSSGDSGSDASSYKSGKSAGTSSSRKKKKIRVKDMKYEDENGRGGRYSGDVDEDHCPHGQGKMKYKDGSVFVGVWSEGSQIHGKTTKARGSSSKSSSGRGDKSSGSRSGKKSSSSDWARIEDGKSNNNEKNNNNGGGSKKKAVRKMKWMDYYGDPGEYTGEVDSSQMPNGKGSMKYDHGLVQEGLWTKGQFVEGSDVDGGGGGGSEGKKSKSKSSSGRSGGSSSRKSRSAGSSRRLEP